MTSEDGLDDVDSAALPFRSVTPVFTNPMDSKLIKGKHEEVDSPSPSDESTRLLPLENTSESEPLNSKKLHNYRHNILQAVSEGDKQTLKRLLKDIKDLSSKYKGHAVQDYFMGKLTSKDTGKTCLMKALLNITSNTSEIVRLLISFAEENGFLERFINAAYTEENYNGQTALHIAIERRQLNIVKYLLDKGADVNVCARGCFFNPETKYDGFYFGETPLALAACTNQPMIVEMLMNHSQTNVAIQDSLGNTVLHALVSIADDSESHNSFIINMYEKILYKCEDKNLESIRNKKGLSPMKLAATGGKLKVLKYILSREVKEKQTEVLSRRFTDWAYGPVSSCLYDLKDVDTSSDNSVLEIVVYNTHIKNRHELLALEPLKTLLQMKWEKFARNMFFVSFLLYFIYNMIFSLLFYRLNIHGAVEFPNFSGPRGLLELFGHIYILIWATYLIIQEGIAIFWLSPCDLRSVLSDAWFHVLFFMQAVFVIVSTLTFVFGVREYLIFVTLAMAIGWTNMMYYTRGFKSLGIYSIMIQRVILNDVLKFLLVYVLYLCGFGVALASLMEHCSDSQHCNGYNSFRTAVVELFKLTIGLGDLEMQHHSKYPVLFLLLLIAYVILTFVLLLNMLIALMGQTVDNISKESSNIWRLQRARTILELEKCLPICLKDKFQLGTICQVTEKDQRLCLRINEVKWTEWHHQVTCLSEEPSIASLHGIAENVTRSHHTEEEEYSGDDIAIDIFDEED